MDLNRLGTDDERQAVVFNLHGLIDATKQIEKLLALLDRQFGTDLEGAAKTTTDLQVQVYDHLAYHLKTLRRPLSRLSNELYRELDRNNRLTPTRSPTLKSQDPPPKARKRPTREGTS